MSSDAQPSSARLVLLLILVVCVCAGVVIWAMVCGEKEPDKADHSAQMAAKDDAPPPVATEPQMAKENPPAPRQLKRCMISGKVMTTEGKPLPRAMVIVYSLNSPVKTRRPVFTSQDGSFQVGGFPREPFTVEVIKDSRGWLLYHNEPTGEPLSIEYPALSEHGEWDDAHTGRITWHQQVNTEIKFAEAAFYINSNNLGPLEEEGVWKLRGIKVGGMKFWIPHAGVYDLVLRMRNPQASDVPIVSFVEFHRRELEHFVVESPEWQEYKCFVELEPDEFYLAFLMVEGWGVDIDTISINALD